MLTEPVINDGLNISMEPGTPVLAPEAGKIVFFYKEDRADGKMCDVVLYGADSNITYVLAHLDSRKIRKSVSGKGNVWANRNSRIIVKPGDEIGVVADYPFKEYGNRWSSPEDKRFWGPFIDHLRVETHYQPYKQAIPSFQTEIPGGEWLGNGFDPLLLFNEIELVDEE
jgi:hypothetical protein